VSGGDKGTAALFTAVKSLIVVAQRWLTFETAIKFVEKKLRRKFRPQKPKDFSRQKFNFVKLFFPLSPKPGNCSSNLESRADCSTNGTASFLNYQLS
jgi:hypothetical protein